MFRLSVKPWQSVHKSALTFCSVLAFAVYIYTCALARTFNTWRPGTSVHPLRKLMLTIIAVTPSLPRQPACSCKEIGTYEAKARINARSSYFHADIKSSGSCLESLTRLAANTSTAGSAYGAPLIRGRNCTTTGLRYSLAAWKATTGVPLRVPKPWRAIR